MQPDLRHGPFEHVVRIGVYGEGRPLPVLHAADVGLVHVGDHAHPAQIVGNREERRGLEARRHGLTFLDLAADHDSVDRSGDRRIAQVLPYLEHIGLRLVVSAFGLVIVVLRRFEVRIADHALVMQPLDPGEVFLLILVFGLVRFQRGRARLQLCLQRRTVYLGDHFALLNDRVVVDVNAVDDARYLRTYLDLDDRLDRTGGGHAVNERSPTHGRAVVCRFGLRVFPQ